MRPVQIKDANADFAKPKDWNDAAFGPCGSLPIRREAVGVAAAAYMAHYSNWKPSAAELAVLNTGGCVELECCGFQPAVSVGVVPCADPDARDSPVDDQFLRAVFAHELDKNGETLLANAVRSGTDNSRGGTAAIAALRRLVGREP